MTDFKHTDIPLMRRTAATAQEMFPAPHTEADSGAYFADQLATMLDLALNEVEALYRKVSDDREARWTLRAQLDHALAETKLVYGELNKALGEHAPKAWDRIKDALGAATS